MSFILSIKVPLSITDVAHRSQVVQVEIIAVLAATNVHFRSSFKLSWWREICYWKRVHTGVGRWKRDLIRNNNISDVDIEIESK